MINIIINNMKDNMNNNTINKNKTKANNVNLNGTKNIVDACLESNVSWMFFSSTSHVYNSSKNRFYFLRVNFFIFRLNYSIFRQTLHIKSFYYNQRHKWHNT